VDRAALSQFSKDDLIMLLLVQDERIVELERRLGLNSGNSGKPPSSDGAGEAARIRSLREPSGKKSGGQKGHPGETLRQVEKPDATIDHRPDACAEYGEKLTAAILAFCWRTPACQNTGMASDHVSRQVFGLAEPRPHRTPHP
jgi:hypothetical protein